MDIGQKIVGRLHLIPAVMLAMGIAAAGFMSCNSSEPEETFTCSGKKVCREMTSCREANYYLKSCGVTSLDGDSDGIPCEVEHCGN